MEDNKEEVGVEFIAPQGWGVDFQSQDATSNSKIWQDPFVETTTEVEADGVEVIDGQEPLLERIIEEEDTTIEEAIPHVDNPVFFLAKQAIADGILANDLEIPEDVGLDFIYEKYKESIIPMAQKQALSEAEHKLQAAGIRDENIALLQAIENNVPVDEIYEVTKFKKYSSLKDDVEDAEKVKVIRAWYEGRGLSEKEIQRNLDAVELNDEIDSEFTSSKEFFANIVDNFEAAQINETAERQRQELALQQKNAQIINNLSTNFQIGEEKLSKTDAELIVDAVHRKQAVEFNGQVYNLSPYEQFYLSLNNDFEFSLKVFKDFLLKDRTEVKIKNKLAETVENDWLEAYKKSQKKSSSTTSIKRKEDREDSFVKTTSNGGAYMEF